MWRLALCKLLVLVLHWQMESLVVTCYYSPGPLISSPLFEKGYPRELIRGMGMGMGIGMRIGMEI